jgi:hypothetical protein
VLVCGAAWIELEWLRISKALNLKGEIVGQAFLPAFCPNGNRERLPYKTGAPFANRICRAKKISKKRIARDMVI